MIRELTDFHRKNGKPQKHERPGVDSDCARRERKRKASKTSTSRSWFLTREEIPAELLEALAGPLEYFEGLKKDGELKIPKE